MSEFYTSGSFLDRKQFFTQYYSIISCLSLRSSDVESVINRLRPYSGFGIETQIANLNNCYSQLKDYKEDVRAEFYSLVKIVDTINDYENKAKGILGGSADDFITAGYESANTNFIGEDLNNYSTIFKDILDYFSKMGNDLTKIIKGLYKFDFIDQLSDIPEDIKSAFLDYLSPIFSSLDAISNVMDIISYYTDGDVSFLDISSTLKDSVSIFESALKIAENISGEHIIPSITVPVSDTVIINGSNVGQFTQYLPVVNVILTTVVSGVKTYEKVSADGEVTVTDGCEIAIDGAMDGLIVCAEALICIACPPAAIGVGIFEIANLLVEKFHGTSIKDMSKDGLKQFAKLAGMKLQDLLGNASFA